MSVMDDEEYKREYDAAAAELDAAAEKATTARSPDGKFAKTEEPAKVEEVKAEPAAEVAKEDPIKALEARVEKAEKIAKDNQAWAHRMAQEAAQLKREREAEQRAANKPAILDANPELADAIRHVVNDPKPQHDEAKRNQAWQASIERVHKGIFGAIDPELEKSIAAKFSEMGESVLDPMEAIRVITEEKVAFAERQVGKRFAAEAAKQAKVSAMSVPGAGAGGGARTAPDSQLAEVERIKNMSDADFAKEVRRVKGF